MGILVALVLIYLSCIIIARASDGFEVAADFLGRKLSDGVKGATINAIGSSMPELLTTFIFLVMLKDAEGFASGLGTTAGSAIFNGVIIPAVVIIAVILSKVSKDVTVSRKVILRDGIALILCELVLIFFISVNELKAIHGLLLMLMYGAYVAFMLIRMDRSKRDPEGTDEPISEENHARKKSNVFTSFLLFSWINLPSWFFAKPSKQKAISLLLIATTLMAVACHYLVEACIWLGSDSFSVFGVPFKGLGVPVYFLSVIIASAATSLPDTILSMKDAKKGNYDDAVSNALGSNIFDICFALGLPLFIYTLIYGPIDMASSTRNDVGELRILLLSITVLAFLIFVLAKRLSLIHALLLISLYLLFTLYIVGRALHWEFLEPIAWQMGNLANYLGSIF